MDTYREKGLLETEIDECLVRDCNLKERETIHAYVDGSYQQFTRTYGFGVVLCVGDRVFEENGSGNNWKLANLRNVTGELLGSMYAIRWAIENNFKKVIIYHDYTGVCEWAVGNWKGKKEETKEYINFIKECEKWIVIEFVKVKAHSGNPKNDMADRLAKDAAGVICKF